MGGSTWSADDYHARASLRATRGEATFAYDNDIRAGRVSRATHAKADPKLAGIRESRDSDAHPTSHAVAVLLDVTGSMREVPKILQANLPKLMGLLIRKSYIEHPQILIGAIGDATCDTSPLQVGQFESGVEIEDDLRNLFLEGGGGGQNTESYELAMYFMARHTALDCFEKRGKRGYLFIIGDEIFYPFVNPSEVAKVIGDTLQAPIPTLEMFHELERTYDVYFVLPKMTSNYSHPTIHQAWTKLLGQKVIRLEDPTGICELIASTVGLAEGAVDIDGVAADLVEAGTTSGLAGDVSKALVPLAAARGPRGEMATLPESGAASGLARL